MIDLLLIQLVGSEVVLLVQQTLKVARLFSKVGEVDHFFGLVRALGAHVLVRHVFLVDYSLVTVFA